MRVYTIILAVRSCKTTGRDALPGFEFLMVKNRTRGSKWELPGGRAEPGETPLECAQREFHEETGRRLRDARPLLRRESPLGDGPVFLGETTSAPLAPLEKETEATAWFRELPPRGELSFPDYPYVETFSAARAVVGRPREANPADP